MQSIIGEAYPQVEVFLKQDRAVLFSGTPCQIAGLKAYLQKDYEKLFCQDIVCHGVPSPAVWQKYVDYRQQKAQSPVKKISFRDKTNGWKQFSMLFEFQNKTIYKSCHQEDPMMKAFLSNICLRPSCHACKFKNQNRQSDVTLADFWGIENVIPEMDDDNGTSLVLLHSEKGKALFEKIKERMIYQSVDSDRALNDNPAAVRPVTAHPKREKFFKNLGKYPFDRLVEKYIDSPIRNFKNFLTNFKNKQ
ncbi:hypothetical protein SDC9_118982 [bioreactor metagenome]|uniref:Coenzyme F420 hydrogenase/dehydrogenase beta subunit C-terminal domain-containing protein n=1 Tax=bioreactor metagenome TaxID=1076179 RepID=A0A645C311_9ZZZZ